MIFFQHWLLYCVEFNGNYNNVFSLSSLFLIPVAACSPVTSELNRFKTITFPQLFRLWSAMDCTTTVQFHLRDFFSGFIHNNHSTFISPVFGSRLEIFSARNPVQIRAGLTAILPFLVMKVLGHEGSWQSWIQATQVLDTRPKFRFLASIDKWERLLSQCLSHSLGTRVCLSTVSVTITTAPNLDLDNLDADHRRHLLSMYCTWECQNDL